MYDRVPKYIVPGQGEPEIVWLVGTITEVEDGAMTVTVESEYGRNLSDHGEEAAMTFNRIPHTGFEVGDRVRLTWERESNAEDSPR